MKLVFWNLFSGGDQEYMLSIVDAYNESQNDVFVESPTIAWADYYTKLVTSVAAGKGPDLAVSHAARVPELYYQGLAAPLDDLANEIGFKWGGITQNVEESIVLDGNHYAIPIDTHPFILYLNKELVTEAGLLDENGNVAMEETPEGFIDFFTKAKKALPQKFPIAMSSTGVDPYRWWWAVYFQMGGTPMLSDDLTETEITMDREIAIKAATYLKSLYHEHELIPPNLGDFYQSFQSGKAVSMLTGVWATGIWEQTEGLEFIPLPLPQLFEQPGDFGGSHTIVMPADPDMSPERKRAGMEFMAFVLDQGAEWAKAGHIPAKTSILQEDAYLEQPYRSSYAEVAQNVVFPSKTIYAGAAQTIMQRNLDLIWTNNASPEEAIDIMIDELEVLVP
ncbi:extracellular solute-binding protein [Aureibacillus halotolerans]|nr:extracellular solute-binding protein [Aureibacillus halotolerans]